MSQSIPERYSDLNETDLPSKEKDQRRIAALLMQEKTPLEKTGNLFAANPPRTIKAIYAAAPFYQHDKQNKPIKDQKLQLPQTWQVQ